jgi:hypothetical protein
LVAKSTDNLAADADIHSHGQSCAVHARAVLI